MTNRSEQITGDLPAGALATLAPPLPGRKAI
jgi:hypothetical protein